MRQATRAANFDALLKNGSAQYSTGRLLACLTMISWGETGAPGASVACTWPATFGPSYVAGAVDQMPAAAAIRAAIAARTTILRMVSPSAACERRDCIRISPVALSVRRFTQTDFFVVRVSCGERDVPVHPPRVRHRWLAL